MSEAMVTSKGQITIPLQVRRALGISAGERVVFTEVADGTIVMRSKRRSILELKGMLTPRTRRKVATADMAIGAD